MCKVKGIRTLNRMGMHLADLGEHKSSQIILAQALRIALSLGSPMFEAKIRNNLALVFHMTGAHHLSRRQTRRAMELVRERIGTDNSFYRRLESNLTRVAA